MTTKLNYICMCLLLVITGCKKQMPTLFSGEDAVGFTLGGDENNIKTVSTFDFPPGSDTFLVPIQFYLHGHLATKERPIGLITDTASHFAPGKDVVLPSAGFFLSGNKTDASYDIKIVAPQESDMNIRVVSFKLLDNEAFTTSVIPDKGKSGKIIFGNFYYKPVNWDLDLPTTLWGDYSAAKLKTIVVANQLNPLAISMLQDWYIIRPGEPEILTTKQFYLFINTLGGYLNAYFYDLLQDMTAKAKAYAAAQKANGTPILDDKGREISFK